MLAGQIFDHSSDKQGAWLIRRFILSDAMQDAPKMLISAVVSSNGDGNEVDTSETISVRKSHSSSQSRFRCRFATLIVAFRLLHRWICREDSGASVSDGCHDNLERRSSSLNPSITEGWTHPVQTWRGEGDEPQKLGKVCLRMLWNRYAIRSRERTVIVMYCS
jgi:hypothetical protein